MTENSRRKAELREQIDALQSQLNNLESRPLVEGYDIVTKENFIYEQTFLEDAIEEAEDELDMLDEEDDKFLNKFFGLDEDLYGVAAPPPRFRKSSLRSRPFGFYP